MAWELTAACWVRQGERVGRENSLHGTTALLESRGPDWLITHRRGLLFLPAALGIVLPASGTAPGDAQKGVWGRAQDVTCLQSRSPAAGPQAAMGEFTLGSVSLLDLGWGGGCWLLHHNRLLT